MESYMYLGLGVLGSIIVSLIFFFYFRNKQHYQNDLKSFAYHHETYQEPSITEETLSNYNKNADEEDKRPLPPLKDDFLVISVMAEKGSKFAAYELLQAILATGMHFGEMNIFHYYSPHAKEKICLFSLASATKPGEFNLDRMGEFSCIGLTLFTNLKEVPDAEEAFELMLSTAEQLAEDLGGKLFAGHRVPWNADMLHEYQQKAMQYL